MCAGSILSGLTFVGGPKRGRIGQKKKGSDAMAAKSPIFPRKIDGTRMVVRVDLTGSSFAVTSIHFIWTTLRKEDVIISK